MSTELHILFLVFLSAGIAAAFLIRLLRRKAKSSGAKPAGSVPESIARDKPEEISGEGHPEPAMSEPGQGEKIRDIASLSAGVAGESGGGQRQDNGAAIANKPAPSLSPRGQADREGQEQPASRAEQRADRRVDSVAGSADELDKEMAPSKGLPDAEPVDAQDKAQAAPTGGAKERKESGAEGPGNNAVSSGAPVPSPSPTATNAEAARGIPERGSGAAESGMPEKDEQCDNRNKQAGQEATGERVQRPAASTSRAASGQTELENGVEPAPPGDCEVAGRAGKGRDMPEEAEQSTELGPLAGERQGTEPRATKTENTDASVQTARSSEKQSSRETGGPVESGGASGPVIDGDAKRTPGEKQQHEPTTGKEPAGVGSGSGTLPRTPRNRRFRKKQPRKYRGLSREAPEQREAAPRQGLRGKPEESAAQRRSLSIQVRIRFQRGGSCTVSLIAKRELSLPEELTALASSGKEVSLLAMQEEWYQDVIPDDLASVLRNGTVWTHETPDGQYSWSLSGREIYVLAARPDMSGYTSQPCLELGRDHVVLCTAEVRERVEKAIQATGARPSAVLDESSGAPRGWIIFRGVVPASPVPPEDGEDIFNALRPLPDIKISLEGGIRLERGKWLEGYPPSVRVYGAQREPEVRIDGRVAARGDDGAYRSPGWDSVGDHSVWCDGKSCLYSMVSFEASPELWDAYTFPIAFGAQKRFVVCGPVVRVGGVAPYGSQTICVSETNPVVLGPEPGQIGMAFKASPVRGAPCIATPGFLPVWALPVDPLHCDKQSTRILFVAGKSSLQQMLQPAGDPRRHKDADIERWCRLILDASRKGMGLHPETAPVRELWREYKKLARRVWRARK